MKFEIKQKVFLRPTNEQDADFLEKVYAESRREEFAHAGFDDLQLKAFLKMQFDFQIQSYKMQFPDAEFFVIEYEKEKVGRLIVNRGAAEIRLIDIIILPEFRGRGIGGFLIGNLQAEAKNAGKTLSLSVLRTNDKAINLYERFGFTSAASDDVSVVMCWEDRGK